MRSVDSDDVDACQCFALHVTRIIHLRRGAEIGSHQRFLQRLSTVLSMCGHLPGDATADVADHVGFLSVGVGSETGRLSIIHVWRMMIRGWPSVLHSHGLIDGDIRYPAAVGPHLLE